MIKKLLKKDKVKKLTLEQEIEKLKSEVKKLKSLLKLK